MAKAKYEKWLEPDGLILIEGWARSGLTEEQIAHNMGVNVKTLYVWKKEYDPINQALKNGKEVTDFIVENALYKRCTGFDYEEEVLVKGTIKKVHKHVPPDTTAIIFWLKNRKPNEWRDKRNVADTSANEDGVEIINDAPGTNQ